MTFNKFSQLLLSGSTAVALSVGVASAEWQELSGSGTTIYAEDGDGAVILGCTDEGDLALGFLLEGDDVEAAVNNPSDRWKLRRGSIFVDGEEVFNNKFVYKPASKLAETNHPRAVVRVYNATIQGVGVEFDLGRHGSVSMSLPESNGAFQNFASDCIDANLSD